MSNRTEPPVASWSHLLPLAAARRVVLDAVRPLPAQVVDLPRALGWVTAEAVTAAGDVPPFANSSMDGYALRAADAAVVPVRLRVVAAVMAGQVSARPVGQGEAVRIMTGAPLPEGADAVVPVELVRTEDDGTTVWVGQAPPVGSHVRRAGDDITAGQEVFGAGTLLTPYRIGVLAGLGVGRVSVYGRPRVGVLSTGDELGDPGGTLAPGKIHDANRPGLLALVEQAGYPALDLGVVGDDEAAIADAFGRALAGCDALVTSGGVSVGDLDVVKVVLDKLSEGTMRWMQIAIKPAKPFAFGLLDGGRLPVFGLAGNPVSAMVGFELFVRPALRTMAGERHPRRQVVPAVAATDLPRSPDGKLHLVRVVARYEGGGNLSVRPSGGQQSHMLLAMAQANALALVPDGDGVAAGEPVDIVLLDPSDATGSSELLDGVGKAP